MTKILRKANKLVETFVFSGEGECPIKYFFEKGFGFSLQKMIFYSRIEDLKMRFCVGKINKKEVIK